MIQKTSYTFKLNDAQQNAICTILRNGNYKPLKVEYTIIAAETEGCNISLYQSGKLLVQGKKAEEFITFVLEPQVLGKAQLGYEDFLNPELSEPHIGIDESGKGDFFGPLVVAAAYVDNTLIDKMREMGVKDSKNITSDKKAISLGSDIRKLLGRRYTVIKIGPEKYNQLYARMRSVNTLLAWAHARAIENMLEILPGCPKAISDQFGKKELIEKALMKKGREIELVQRHKAESDLAVAAASIIAREEFLRSLIAMEKEYLHKIPKGASDAVREAAIDIAKNKGTEILVKIGKCHFKTTDAILHELGKDRSSLPPEGRVKSQVRKAFYARHSSGSDEASAG